MMECDSFKMFGEYPSVPSCSKHWKHSNIWQTSQNNVPNSGASVQELLAISVIMEVKKTRLHNVLTPRFLMYPRCTSLGQSFGEKISKRKFVQKKSGEPRVKFHLMVKKGVCVDSDNITVPCLHEDADLWATDVNVRSFNLHCLTNLEFSNVFKCFNRIRSIRMF